MIPDDGYRMLRVMMWVISFTCFSGAVMMGQINRGYAPEGAGALVGFIFLMGVACFIGGFFARHIGEWIVK